MLSLEADPLFGWQNLEVGPLRLIDSIGGHWITLGPLHRSLVPKTGKTVQLSQSNSTSKVKNSRWTPFCGLCWWILERGFASRDNFFGSRGRYVGLLQCQIFFLSINIGPSTIHCKFYQFWKYNRVYTYFTLKTKKTHEYKNEADTLWDC